MEQSKSNPKTKSSDNKEQVFGSSAEFFSELEKDVNGAIDDSLIAEIDQQEQTLEARNESPIQAQPEVPAQQATPPAPQGNSNSNIDWEKRYKDSSREAQKLSAKVQQLRPFEPLMAAMRKDTGLLDHIKDYLQTGGKPSKNIKEELGLGEDFHYDASEAVENPESDSAKVFEAHVDKAVKAKVNKALNDEKQKKSLVNGRKTIIQAAKAFQKKNNLNDDAMKAVLKKATTSKINFDEAFYLLNRGNQAQKIANNVRQDVAQQMQNVRNIPQSVSQTNSVPAEKNPTDAVFDSLLSPDDDVDNLFG